jgi:hypothetical protein
MTASARQSFQKLLARRKGHHLHRGAENFWSYFFLAGDLNEIPRRIAAFFMDSDDRWVSLTTSSNDFEERASSINRRSSLNDQRLFRTIQKPSVRTKPPSHVCAP